MGKTKKEKREIYVTLTGPELLLKGSSMAGLNEKIGKLDADRKKYASNASSNIKVLQQEVDKLSQQIREKKELREVECELRYNFDAGIAEYYYDNNKVDERPIADEERQESLNI